MAISEERARDLESQLEPLREYARAAEAKLAALQGGGGGSSNGVVAKGGELRGSAASSADLGLSGINPLYAAEQTALVAAQRELERVLHHRDDVVQGTLAKLEAAHGKEKERWVEQEDVLERAVRETH